MTSKAPKILLRWHGLKRNKTEDGCPILPKADLYIDCRGIAEHGIEGNTGHTNSFQEGIKAASPLSLGAMTTLIVDSLRFIETRRSGKPDPFKEPYVVCFMCAWGMHRSPATASVVGEKLKELGFHTVLQP